MGCLPHMVLEKVFKYSTNAAGFNVSIVSMPLKKKKKMTYIIIKSHTYHKCNYDNEF